MKKLIIITVFLFMSLASFSQIVCPTSISELFFTMKKIMNETEVGTIYACDPDGDDITWDIVNGDDDNHFRIENGVIIINDQYNIIKNYEKSYILTISATDNGVPVLSSYVDVIIYINENVVVNIYPNPFRHILKIDLELSSLDHEINIEVFNSLGEHVKYITTRQKLPNGFYNYTWNASNGILAGIYYIRININGAIKTQKVIFTN